MSNKILWAGKAEIDLKCSTISDIIRGSWCIYTVNDEATSNRGWTIPWIEGERRLVMSTAEGLLCDRLGLGDFATTLKIFCPDSDRNWVLRSK